MNIRFASHVGLHNGGVKLKRLPATAGVILLAAVACGQSPADSTTNDPVDDAVTTTSTNSVATTRSDPDTTSSTLPVESGLDLADDMLVDLSLLSVASEMIAPSGRFRLETGRPSEGFLKSVEGRYWVTPSANVYTSLAIDTELVASEMDRLVELLTGPGMAQDSLYLEALEEHYRGDEFQLGLTDVARRVVGPIRLDGIEQFIWAAENDSEGEIPPEFHECRDSITAYDDAARRWIRGLDIELNKTDDAVEVWELPADEMNDALAAEHAATSVCEQIVATTPSAASTLRLEVAVEVDGVTRIEVYSVPSGGDDREPLLDFSILISPDEDSDSPPDEPFPAHLFTTLGAYSVAIDTCGELPWEYDRSSDTYWPPGTFGPVSILYTDWLCSDQVPEDRREG